MRPWNSFRLPSQMGKTKVGGIDFNQARMRHVTTALVAVSARPGGFTASQLAARVRECGESNYQPRQAAYDLKKLRGKDMVCRAEMQGLFRELGLAA